MAYTDTWGITLKTEAGTIHSTAFSIVGPVREGLDEVVAVSTTGSYTQPKVLFAKIKSMSLISDKDVTVTTDVTAQVSIALKAGIAVNWTTNSNEACPITANVSTWHIANASATDPAHVRFSFLLADA